MDEAILLSHIAHIEEQISKLCGCITVCVGHSKTGKRCDLKPVGETRFCNKHQKLSIAPRYMVRDAAYTPLVYHSHAPNVSCDCGCPRYNLQTKELPIQN